jgi:hypothetical protein
MGLNLQGRSPDEARDSPGELEAGRTTGMARRGRQAADFGNDPSARRGPSLKPVRTVKRELVSPGGRKVLVDVPVYPPFRLEAQAEERSAKKPNEPQAKTPGAAPEQPASDDEASSE